jgi:MFS family permease
MAAEHDSKNPLSGEFDGLTLKDVTPKLERIWIKYPRLVQLNLLLLCAFLGQTATGYDGSMLNGMQALPQWQAYFGSPTGGRLGAMVNGIVFGVLISLTFSSQLCEKIGRRYPITIGTSIIIIGSILQTAAVHYAMFVLGRFLIGIGGGLVAVAAPQLMMECAYPSQRGKMVSLYMTQWPVVSPGLITMGCPVLTDRCRDISLRHGSLTAPSTLNPRGVGACLAFCKLFHP